MTIFDFYILVNSHTVEPALNIKQHIFKEKITLTWTQLSSITRLSPSGIPNVKTTFCDTRTFSHPGRWLLL